MTTPADVPPPWDFQDPPPAPTDQIVARMAELTDTELRVALAIAATWTTSRVDPGSPAALAARVGRGVDAVRQAIDGLTQKGLVVPVGGLAPPDWVRLNVRQAQDALEGAQDAIPGPSQGELIPGTVAARTRRSRPAMNPWDSPEGAPTQADMFVAVAKLHGVNPSAVSQGTRFALAKVATKARELGADVALIEGPVAALWAKDWRSRNGRSRPSPSQIEDLIGIAIQGRGAAGDSPAARAAKITWRQVMSDWLARGGINSGPRPAPFEEWFAAQKAAKS